MKLSLLILIASILTVSCNRYQYFTIGSKDARTNEAQELIVENDSFSITYNFNGLNAPVHMKVFNKLDRPVYLDWKRSSLIVNGQAISYMPGSLKISGAGSGSSFALTDNAAAYDGSFSATAELPVDWQLIPPQSYIIRIPLSVTSEFFKNVPDSMFSLVRVPLNDGSIGAVRTAQFSSSNTPMRFKSFLTFQVGDAIPGASVAYNHEFYISELVRTGIRPKKYMLDREQQGNQAYLQKISGFGKGLGAVGATLLVATVAGATEAAVEAVSGKNCNNCNPCNNQVRY